MMNIYIYIYIYIYMTYESNYRIMVDARDTIEIVKEKIYEKEGVSSEL